MRRRKSIREDGEDEEVDHYRWTILQIIAVVLQVIEVSAVVALALVAYIVSQGLSISQDRIVEAITSLHHEVQKQEAIIPHDVKR